MWRNITMPLELLERIIWCICFQRLFYISPLPKSNSHTLGVISSLSRYIELRISSSLKPMRFCSLQTSCFYFLKLREITYIVTCTDWILTITYLQHILKFLNLCEFTYEISCTDHDCILTIT